MIFEGSQTVKVGKGLNSDYTQPTPLLRKMFFVLSRAWDKEKFLVPMRNGNAKNIFLNSLPSSKLTISTISIYTSFVKISF